MRRRDKKGYTLFDRFALFFITFVFTYLIIFFVFLYLLKKTIIFGGITAGSFNLYVSLGMGVLAFFTGSKLVTDILGFFLGGLRR